MNRLVSLARVAATRPRALVSVSRPSSPKELFV